MAFFKKNKKEDKVKEVKIAEDNSPEIRVDEQKLGKTKNDSEKKKILTNLVNTDLSWVLRNPRMSEKAMYASDKNVYVFDIDKRANKRLIMEAVKSIYKITPKKVNVSKIAKKNVRNQRTGIRGVKSGGKKAYIYLNEGDKINIV